MATDHRGDVVVMATVTALPAVKYAMNAGDSVLETASISKNLQTMIISGTDYMLFLMLKGFNESFNILCDILKSNNILPQILKVI